MIRRQSVMLIAMILFSSGCAATKQARTVERLGFLKDLYPKMSEGNENAGESLLIYKSPKVALIPPNTYTKFMLDPVEEHGRIFDYCSRCVEPAHNLDSLYPPSPLPMPASRSPGRNFRCYIGVSDVG